VAINMAAAKAAAEGFGVIICSSSRVSRSPEKEHPQKIDE
jgi:aspartate 1-decarboxylase